MSRVIIVVDGSNMFHRLRELEFRNLLSFDYQKFAQHLAGDASIVSCAYYIGKVRAKDDDKDAQKRRSDQQKLTASLKNAGWKVEFGHILNNREKGVDVHIVVDMLKGAYKDVYDRVIVVSSDTDLIPAIQEVREVGKEVEYVGFSHKPSFGLIKHASVTTLLKKEDVTLFLQT